MTHLQRTLRIVSILAVPLLEWFVLRYFIHETLQFDHGLLVPAAAVFVIVLWSVSEPLRARYPILLLNLALLAGAVYTATRTDLVLPVDRLIILQALAGAALVTALFVRLAPSDWFRAAFADPVRTAFCIAGLFLYRIFVPCRELAWPYLSGPTTTLARALLEATGLTFLPSGPDRIWHENIKVFIAPACSGLEGVFLFGSMFSMLMALDYKRFGARWIVAGYAAGTLWMLMLNIIRIAAIVLVAVGMTDPADPDASGRFVREMFHLNSGWIMYLTGAMVFVSIYYGLIRRYSKGRE